MNDATDRNAAESGIRALLDDWQKATRARDVDAIVACYADGIVAFDAIGPLRFEGAGTLRKHLEGCLSCMQGDMIFDIHEPAIAAEGDLGFCHFLVHCGGTTQDGTVCSGWLRTTACLRRTDGGWKIVHDHCSAPFDPASGKAVLDLVPGDAPAAARPAAA